MDQSEPRCEFWLDGYNSDVRAWPLREGVPAELVTSRLVTGTGRAREPWWLRSTQHLDQSQGREDIGGPGCEGCEKPALGRSICPERGALLMSLSTIL